MAVSYARDVLPNGLRVVTVEMPHLHTAMLAIYVRTGSRHERADDNGVSHFLEHMFFRGSEKYPDTVRMNAAVEEVGGNLNGVTTRDHGYYYTPIHPDHVDLGLDVLGDMLCRPKLVEMETERRVILEEMLDEVDDRGRDIDVDNLSRMVLFAGHPLAQKIAGTRASVRALGHDALVRHLERHYVSGNLIVCATGAVKRDAVLASVERSFAGLRQGPATRERAPKVRLEGPRLRFVHHGGESQTEFRLSFLAIPEQHEDFPAIALLRGILDDGLGSRLPYHVVERLGLAYSIHASLDAYIDVGLFEVDAMCAPDRAAPVAEEIFRVLGELCDRPVGEDELARAQRRFRMMLDFAQDSPADLAAWYGGTELFRRPESHEERIAAVDRQTPATLQRVARRYFTARRLTATAVGPRKGARALERVVLTAAGLPR
jgi:predicted Zn-dependent peptidase